MAFISYRVIGQKPTCFDGESPQVRIYCIVSWSPWSNLLFGGGGGAASILGAELRSCPSGCRLPFRASVSSTVPLSASAVPDTPKAGAHLIQFLHRIDLPSPAWIQGVIVYWLP